MRDARGNVPPAACRGGVEWALAQQNGSYLGRGISGCGGWGERLLRGCGKVGERSALMGSARLPLVLLTCPLEVRKGNCKRGFEGKSIPKKSSLSGWRGVQARGGT